MKIKSMIEKLDNTKARSAWKFGVKWYALDIVESIDNETEFDEITTAMKSNGNAAKRLEKFLLNGACDWSEYSNGGCSLIYNKDIAKRLCTPSELKRTNNGKRNPNKNETWLDVQTRAWWQAFQLIKNIILTT